MPARVWAPLLLASVLAACSHATEKNRQRQTAKSLIPAALEPARPAVEVVHTGRVRAYADAGYRAQNPGWEQKLAALLRRASEVLEPSVGLRLELVETLPWERRAAAGEMDAMLRELEILDGAADVDWVLGLVDALPEVSSSMHQLGLAHMFGRHVVLRGLNDLKEVAVLEAVLGRLDAEERRALYQRRKQHKELVLFLHEIAHTLGALHVVDDKRILHAHYSDQQASFSPHNLAVMRIVVAGRLGEGADDQEVGARLLAHVEASEWDGWIAEERAALLELLEDRAGGGARSGEIPDLGVGVRPVDREKFRRAIELEAAGRSFDAWEVLEPLVEFYPDEPPVQLLACRLALRRELPPKSISAHCRRAAEVAPADPEPALGIALAIAEGDDRGAAIEALAGAAAKLEAAPGDQGAGFRRLAEAYRKLEVVSLAEAAAQRAGGPEAILEWSRQTRARYGLSPDAAAYGITPALEAEYVEAVKGLLRAVYARKFEEAARLAAAHRRRFGDAPGLLAALCDLEIRRRRYEDAARHCRRALAAYDGLSWAHYLTGLLEKRDKRAARASAHLERAIELDPDLRHAFKVLEELYEEAGRAEDLARLREVYRKRF